MKLRASLKEAQAENERQRNEIDQFRKKCEIADRNNSSLLLTAKNEVQRKEVQIHELRKE